MGKDCHIVKSENGSVGLISGVQTMMLKTYKGCMDPEEIRESIRDLGNLDKFLHNPKTGL